MHLPLDGVVACFSFFAATSVTKCTKLPLGSLGGDVRAICWIDQNTLIVGQRYNKQVVQLRVYTPNKSCQIMKTLVRNYIVEKMTCYGGKVYLNTLHGENKNATMIYDLKDGTTELWSPSEISEYVSLTVLNQDLIVLKLPSKEDDLVYDKYSRVLLYRITYENVGKPSLLYLTESKFLWGANGVSILLRNMDSSEVKVVEGGVYKPQYLSGLDGEYVLVTGYNNNEVGVYTEQGTFLNFVQFDPARQSSDVTYNDVIKTPQGQTLFVFGNDVNSYIDIYTLE